MGAFETEKDAADAAASFPRAIAREEFTVASREIGIIANDELVESAAGREGAETLAVPGTNKNVSISAPFFNTMRPRDLNNCLLLNWEYVSAEICWKY